MYYGYGFIAGGRGLTDKSRGSRCSLILGVKKVVLVVIGGFNITQVSLIITQVKNKIAYHSIN